MMNWIYTAVMNELPGVVSGIRGAPGVDAGFRRLRLTPAMSGVRDLWLAGAETLYQRDAVASQLTALAYTPTLAQYADAVDPRLTYDPRTVRGHASVALLSGDQAALRMSTMRGLGYGASREIEIATSTEAIAARYDGGIVNSRPLTWKSGWSVPVPIVDAQLSVRVSLAAAEAGARFSLRHDGEVALDVMALHAAMAAAEPYVQELMRPESAEDVITVQLRELWNSDVDAATELGAIVCAYAVRAASISRGL